MQLTEFHFPFDPSLIASHPVQPRDQARLLVMPRNQGPCQDRTFIDLPSLLQPGDLLVVNNTKVLPVRLVGTKLPGGGKIELVLIKPHQENVWEVLLKGRVRVGQDIDFGQHTHAMVIERSKERTLLRFPALASMFTLLDRLGHMPLPPYIKRRPTEADRQDYQTIFAQVAGAIAAPTAGLHFTTRIVKELESREIHLSSITLHVGPGTFRPVTTSTIEQHRMETEWFDVPKETAQAIQSTQEKGGRIIAVGTTVARSLEAASQSGEIIPTQGETDLFIVPGYAFKIVNGLITNFHLPGTTLLMLIAAFAGLEQARTAYEHAIQSRYRFYSYGDAMLIQ